MGGPFGTAQVGDGFQDSVVNGMLAVLGRKDRRQHIIFFFRSGSEQSEKKFKNPFHRQVFLPEVFPVQSEGGGQYNIVWA